MTWPIIRDQIVGARRLTNITYEGLIINPENKKIACHCDRSIISSSFVKKLIEDIPDYFNENLSEIIAIEAKILLKKYNVLPVIHGYNINNKYLGMGTTHFKKGNKLAGEFDAYFLCEYDKNNPAINTFFKTFNSWFSFLWENSDFVCST